ncbi:MAG TPA: S28 family serine protease [Polyangiaceae bacterium]|nr:S28 family serine protease [Polyangiaceae bacterium]
MTKMRSFMGLVSLPLLAAAAGCQGAGDAPGGRPEGATAAAAAALADEGAELLARLNAIEGVEAVLNPPRVPGILEFALTIEQPTDHANPAGERFKQHVTIRHRSTGAPTVLGLSGYFGGNPARTFDTQLSLALGANHVFVEHRFFGQSAPASLDWKHLTIEQAAADDHRLVEALKPIYEGAWLSEGGSKGGMEAIYHRRFYPDDVAGTVAFVAPQIYGNDDPRFALFLEKVGTKDCRDRFVAAQREALARRDEIVPHMQQFAGDFGLPFDVLGFDLAFEHTIIESRFYLWQYRGGELCATVPQPGAPGEEFFNYFLEVAGLGWYLSDEDMASFAPFFYQASTELGYYGPSLGFRLHDLLEYPGTFYQSTYPPEVPEKLDPWAMPDIQFWLATKGERIMLIYGELDPWTAGAFALGQAKDSYRFTNAGGPHSTNLDDLSEADRAKAAAVLESWTGVKPQMPSAEGARALRASGELADDRELRDPRRAHFERRTRRR